MGQRNPDRIPLRDRYENGRDVAGMIKHGWDALSICRSCQLTMPVDLKLIAYVRGPKVSLWNRKAKCRRLLCPGIVEFHAKAPGMIGHQKMVFDEREIERAPNWARDRIAAVAAERQREREERTEMCNHYRRDPDWRLKTGDFSETRIPVRFDRTSLPNEEIKTHIYPGRAGEILVVEGGEPAALSAVWTHVEADYRGSFKDYRAGKFTKGRNNCRSEKADTAKTWAPVAANRCLIPLDGFCEYDDWRTGKAIEYLFTWPDARPMFAAGLFGWAEPTEGRMLTFTMLTKEAGGDTASIGHKRQPVILETADDLVAWLDPAHPIQPFSERLSPAGTFAVSRIEKPAKVAATA